MQWALAAVFVYGMPILSSLRLCSKVCLIVSWLRSRRAHAALSLTSASHTHPGVVFPIALARTHCEGSLSQNNYAERLFSVQIAASSPPSSSSEPSSSSSSSSIIPCILSSMGKFFSSAASSFSLNTNSNRLSMASGI